MKKTLSLLAIMLVAFIGAIGQAPGLLNYQGVARNSAGNVLVNKTITLRLTIRDGSAAGAAAYQESRSVTTNPFGLFNVQVGSAGASNVTGTIPGVNWAVGAKFIQVEIDPNGGTTFIDIGTGQLASVPYALNAAGAAPIGPAGGDLSGTYPNPVIANGAVTTVKIADGAVTTQKIMFPIIKTQLDAGALLSLTNSGTGDGISGINTGTGRGGYFQVNNPASTADGLRGETNGTGASWGIRGISSGTNGAGLFQQTNATNTANNLQSNQAGLGRAGFFQATNAANTANALEATTTGTGFAIRAASTNGTPRALLTVGGVQLTGINEGINKILTSDAAGNATWQLPAVSSDLVLPFNKTQNENGFLFRLTNSGTTATSSAIEGVTNSQAANVSAVVGTVSSTSSGNRSAGVLGINNGTTTGIGVYGSAGGGWGVYGNSVNSIGVIGNSPNAIGVVGNSTSGDGVDGFSTTGVGVYGTSVGGHAGYFSILDNPNTSDALTGNTFGSGDAVVGINRGTGKAGYFWVANPASTAGVIDADQYGLGGGVHAFLNNTGNVNPALHGETNGPGTGVLGRTSGTGYAASFLVLNPTSSSAAMNVGTNGTGSGITVRLTNGINTSRGIDVLQSGVGPGVFSVSAGGNAVWGITSNVSAAGVIGDNTFGEAVVGRNRGGFGVGAVVGRNDSTGYGVRGFNTKDGIGVLGQAGISFGTGVGGRFENVYAANGNDALQGFTNGPGWAANFANTNDSSAARGVRISTRAGKGGNALTIANGTLATSYENAYASNTVIDDAVLVVTAPGSVTIPTGPPLRDGTHIWVVNNSGVLISIINTTTGPLNVSAGSAQHLIFVSAVSGTNWIPAQ